MHLKQLFQKLFLLLNLLLYVSTSCSEIEHRNIQYSPVPSWVKHFSIDVDAPVPLTEIEEGVYFRTVESQLQHISGRPYELYVRRALAVISAQGMEYSSSFNVDFDPSYQTVELHKILVRRAGNVIDKTESARVSVIQREERMEALIYDGTLTANVIIDDVRVGDVVEYSYSRIGRNPVYGDLLSLRRQTNFSVPVQQLRIRALVDKDKPFQVKKINTELNVTEKALGEYIEYSVQDNNIQPLRYETNSPRWYDPYGQVNFSELKSWQQVANWAFPLYEQAIIATEEIEKIARDIRKNNPEKI